MHCSNKINQLSGFIVQLKQHVCTHQSDLIYARGVHTVSHNSQHHMLLLFYVLTRVWIKSTRAIGQNIGCDGGRWGWGRVGSGKSGGCVCVVCVCVSAVGWGGGCKHQSQPAKTTVWVEVIVELVKCQKKKKPGLHFSYCRWILNVRRPAGHETSGFARFSPKELDPESSTLVGLKVTARSGNRTCSLSIALHCALTTRPHRLLVDAWLQVGVLADVTCPLGLFVIFIFMIYIYIICSCV